MDQIKYRNGVHLLNSLKRRTELFLAGSIICVLFVAFAYFFYMDALFIKALIITDIVFIGILLIMINLSYKKIMMAKLILDNGIIHLKETRVILSNAGNEYQTKDTVAETIVSCFGLLLGTKIIKYNQDHINLKSVELSEKYMTLVYESKYGSKKIRIHHAPMTVPERIRISETFRYETGVKPVLVDEL